MNLRTQKGQTLVLLAVLMMALVGFAGLVIDSGRLYVERRDLQQATDGAALYAGDTFQHTLDWSAAEQNGLTSYTGNRRIYGASSCSPGWGGPPSGGTIIINCTFAGSSATLTFKGQDFGISGQRFEFDSSEPVTLAVIQALTGQQSVTITAQAATLVNDQSQTPALLTLNQAGCSGNPGSSLGFAGSTSINIVGDIRSNGNISVSGSGLSADVAGNVTECGSPVPSSITLYCYPSNTAPSGGTCPAGSQLGTEAGGQPIIADPSYAPPITTGLAGVSWASGTVVQHPGIFNGVSLSGSNCYFLAAGIYEFQGTGFSISGGFVSNELRPPMEPDLTASPPTAPQANQFWNTNGVKCDGYFQPTAVPASGNPFPSQATPWGVEVTALRQDPYPYSASCNTPTCYTRESAPSVCRPVSITPGPNLWLQVQISNVPGAQGYNIYLSPSGCSAPQTSFGLVPNKLPIGTVSDSTEQNGTTTGCASFVAATCSLGVVTVTLTNQDVNGGWSPGVGAAVNPPDEEGPPAGTGYPNTSNTGPTFPPGGPYPKGDRANEFFCANSAGVPTACKGTVTPGAVEIYLEGTSSGGTCSQPSWSMTGTGDVYTFSGVQYNWIAFDQGGTNTPCPDTSTVKLAGSTNTSFVGLVYANDAQVQIVGNTVFLATVSGGVIAKTAQLSGNATIDIHFNPVVAPRPPASKLVL